MLVDFAVEARSRPAADYRVVMDWPDPVRQGLAGASDGVERIREDRAEEPVANGGEF
jgi:hypothetical protein